MNLDFILIVVGYLAIVLFLHYTIKMSSDKSDKQPRRILKKVSSFHNDDNTSDTSSETSSSNSSITSDRRNDIISEDDDFMKYLNIEDRNKNESVKKAIESQKVDAAFDDNLFNKYSADLFKEQHIGAELDKYFENNADIRYSFDPVPTNDINQSASHNKQEQSTNELLYGNETPLNKENDNDGISAFDEFGNSNFSSQFASL
jgi:FtsZ-interacting cell division protein ZipA